jgi:hypothetical protein
LGQRQQADVYEESNHTQTREYSTQAFKEGFHIVTMRPK